jgi:ATP-binding cassette, subfamily G (WHITE), member 2, PDR
VIIVAFFVFFTVTYLTATEFVTEKKSKGEVLLFQRTHRPRITNYSDLEKRHHSPRGTLDPRIRDLPSRMSGFIEHQNLIFHWRDICYDIKIKNEGRRILDHVDGWVKPGSLTALMVMPLENLCGSTYNVSRSMTNFQTLGPFWSWKDNFA